MAIRPRKSRKIIKTRAQKVNALTFRQTAVDLGVHTQIAELKNVIGN